MKHSFENSVNALVKSYFNNTLRPGNSCMCGVGNLILAANPNLRLALPSYDPLRSGLGWYDTATGEYLDGLSWYKALVHKRNNLTLKDWPPKSYNIGYSLEQIDKLERAFENNCVMGPEKIEVLPGLLAMVDVLAEIHGIDLTVAEKAKELFYDKQPSTT